MANRAGEIGQLREEELPVVRVIVPPDLRACLKTQAASA
jgi:hypothetical protein